MKERIIKVFCRAAEQKKLSKEYRLIERYPAFALFQVPRGKIALLSRKYPVEDMTDLYTIHLADKQVNTSRPRLDRKGKALPHPAYRGAKPTPPGRHHYIVQFKGPIKAEWLRGVKKAGGEPRAPFEGFAYVVRSDEEALKRIMSLPFVRWAGHLPASARMAPASLPQADRGKRAASPLPRTKKVPGVYTVEFFGSEDLTRALPALKSLGFKVLAKDAKAKVLVVAAGGKQGVAPEPVVSIASIHGVRFVRERSVKRPSNNVAAGIMGAARSMETSGSGLGLSGKGEYIGVCDTGLDTGDPSTIHRDFAARIHWIKSYPINQYWSQLVKNPRGDDGPGDLDSGHGTHVAGSILGSGAGSKGLVGSHSLIRGLAYDASLVFQAVEQEMRWKDPQDGEYFGRYLLSGIPLDLALLFADAYKKGVRIHSNSWGGGDPGAYDEQCEQLDRFVWEHKDFCVVVAAGNDGTDRDGDGKINAMSVTAPGTAKNCITVGASENNRPDFNSQTYGKWWPSDYPASPFHGDAMANNPGQLAAFSSRGPTADGRIKPEIVSPGTFVLSTRSSLIAPNNMGWAAFPSNKLYFYMGGTSMATPLTAGAVALIRQFIRTRAGIKAPSAALLKASLIAGATRLPGYSTDTVLLDNQQGFGRVNLDAVLLPPKPAVTRFFEARPGLKTGEIKTLKVAVESSRAPLRVVLSYSDYPGPRLVNNLNLIVSSPDGKRHLGNQAAASLKADVKNNVEVVRVSKPRAGDWKIEVIGSNVPHGPQDFALVYMGHVGGG